MKVRGAAIAPKADSKCKTLLCECVKHVCWLGRMPVQMDGAR